MTTIFQGETQCGVCGKQHTVSEIGSTSTFGSPDLDTRPAEMARSTIWAHVKRCPDCGYCASNLSEVRPGAKEIVNSERYREQLTDANFPELANSFLCLAIIEQELKDFAQATWAFIYAAWACDDAKKPKQAIECRRKAAETLRIAEEQGQKIGQAAGVSTVILVDLLRRSGQAEEARKVIASRRDQKFEKLISQILDFQEKLLDKNDVNCHTIVEASSEYKNN